MKALKIPSVAEKNRVRTGTNSQHELLSILVPAWKHEYLHEALTSIASQTDQRFSAIIFDDAGPPEIRRIATQFPQFKYIRFDTNLGGKDLVAHWNRCLENVHTEWAWVFSDDDVMSSNCVSEFYKGISIAPHAAIFQFTVKQVDNNLQQIKGNRPLKRESAEDFIRARLRSAKISCVPNYVFNWNVLREKAGGFVNFPLAWNSDDATWVLLAKENGFFGLKEGEVLWRQSPSNISSSHSNSLMKFDADIQYLEWLRKMRFRISYWKQIRWLASRIAFVYEFDKTDRSIAYGGVPLRLKSASILKHVYTMLRCTKSTGKKGHLH